MAVRKTAAGLRLKRWFKEDWRTPRGKKDYNGGENTFRPTKRISKDTPSTWSELSKGERRRAQIEKNTKGRVSKYKKNKMENGGNPRGPRPYAPNPGEGSEVGKGLSAKRMRTLRKMSDDFFNKKAKDFEYTPQTKQRRFVEELKPQTVIDKKNKKMEKGGIAKSEGGNPFNTSSGRKDRFKKFTREERRKRRDIKRRKKNCPDIGPIGPDTKLVDGCPKPADDFREKIERTLPPNFKKSKKKDNSSEYELEFNMAKGGMSTPAWTRKEGKSPSGGLNRKGIASYRRANPGSKLSMAVTTKPSKLKAGSKAAKRRKSFCARMSGVKGPMKDEKGRPTRKAKALRKWNCKHGCAVMVKRKSKK